MPDEGQRHKRLNDIAERMEMRLEAGALKTAEATMSLGAAFFAFINRGSVVDLAIGIVVGGAFTSIVQSFVNDLISPIIGLATQKNLNNMFLIIHCSANSTLGCRKGSDHPYGTVLQATTDGAATWNYGNFLTSVINFLLISSIMFLLVQLYSNAFLKTLKKTDSAPKKTKPCSQCFEQCHFEAIKCKCCLSFFPPKPDASSPRYGPAENNNSAK
ncbi:hypothetical protein CcCBS67573_g01602 [Chytriomyces confervae]|uniref:Large conductance mechanosensitive channel protein n=1 Tax=Chytriomyces confervae TaxID=246404 RepID=A0A507FNT3_9FUNG|nr:hypothetical protein HDU80_002319 [Chytriomyces hyalinus]TPX77128.1 hypothetical protein CcCBS67573_g01602 [Chytriomyces confervae]